MLKMFAIVCSLAVPATVLAQDPAVPAALLAGRPGEGELKVKGIVRTEVAVPGNTWHKAVQGLRERRHRTGSDRLHRARAEGEPSLNTTTAPRVRRESVLAGSIVNLYFCARSHRVEGKPSPVPFTTLMFTMPRRHKVALAIAFAIPVSSIAVAFSLGPAPEKTLRVPVVIKEVTNKSMPDRDVAIRFLGESKNREALPVLESIVNDETERAEDRADALHAISEIDGIRARELASVHASRSDNLGSSAKALSN
jgi:hypothetical protein